MCVAGSTEINSTFEKVLFGRDTQSSVMALSAGFNMAKPNVKEAQLFAATPSTRHLLEIISTRK